VESLYFGCPVFGTPYGSLPEIVQPHVGFLSNNVSELVHAIKNVNNYSKKDCYEQVMENFTSKQMALNYLKKYETVLSGEHLNKTAPVLQQIQTEKFLPFY
jgi:glycosyltransferase involved in cell wall biosynthesis